MVVDRVRTRSILAGILATAAALAWPAGASADLNSGVEFAAGYRIDDLDWNKGVDPAGISGPNILSELTWKNLQIYEVQGRAHAENDYGIYGKAMLGYGWIVHGKNQDSDYNGNDRTQEFSRSNNSANGGYVWDGSIGLGYDFHPAEVWSFIPLMGASINTQSLAMMDGNQTLPAAGPFPGLNSSYTAEWWGPWNGLDVQYAPGRLRLGASGEYHWGTAYAGRGNWNLRPDLQHPTSFEHHAHGSGYVATGQVGYVLSERWTLRGEGQWQEWTAGPGTDSMYFSDGTSASLTLNRVHWRSVSGSLVVEYGF